MTERLSARRAAFDLLREIEKNSAYSNLALSACLRQGQFAPRDAALVSALVYGVLERRLTLDYILGKYLSKPVEKTRMDVLILLRLGAYQIVFLDKIPVSAAVNESVKLAKTGGCAFAAGMINAVLRKVAADNGDWRERGFSIRYSCPQELIDLWVGAYGAKAAEELLKSALGRPRTYLRANLCKTTPEQLIEALEQEGVHAVLHPAVPGAVEADGLCDVERSPAFRAGLFHVQGISSQICAQMLGARPGETVLDVCAAPGGKSFTIAQAMEDAGCVYAFDLYAQRVELIRQGAHRLGLACIRAQVRDAAAGLPPVLAQRVLCDVPCSGLGEIAGKPEIRYKTLRDIDKLPDLQYRILENSATCVQPGGTLLYSTCTLHPAENEQVCRRFLSAHTEFAPVAAQGGAACIRSAEGFCTFLPHLTGGDGFFAAVLHRREQP